jgi:hypothetical protein
MHAGTLRSAAAWRVGAATACVCAAGAQHPRVREKFRRHGKNAPARSSRVMSRPHCCKGVGGCCPSPCWGSYTSGCTAHSLSGYVCTYGMYGCMRLARREPAGRQQAGAWCQASHRKLLSTRAPPYKRVIAGAALTTRPQRLPARTRPRLTRPSVRSFLPVAGSCGSRTGRQEIRRPRPVFCLK